ncbi:MAG: di-trans,poly-cis-decaprenylcistransferase [Planctomycetes bacterium]|nr:di-trans,poly-cis-decaprenylcistransferase [Planctomycetota bacterium]
MGYNTSLTKEKLVKILKGVNIPKHIAIIMDGNGRWALSRNKARIQGHKAGVKTVDEIAESCAKIGVERLTLYAFSSENWRRPADEVSALMHMLHKYLIDKRGKLLRNRIRLTAIGDLEYLPDFVKRELNKTMEISSNCSRMTLCLALNYGGKKEILDAVNKLIKNKKRIDSDVTEEEFQKYLYDPSITDPELLIRTGGEIRISNFLLWHISYAELYFTNVLWPDFRTFHLLSAIKEFSKKKRRFGGLDDYQS